MKRRGHGAGRSGVIRIHSEDREKLKLLKEELASQRMSVYFPPGKEKEMV